MAVLAITLAVAGLIVPTIQGQAASCPTNGPLSCQNTTIQSNTCCFNAPGGSLLQTQFWDYNPSTGPVDSWTVHGLWPDHCDGTFDASCDPNRAYTNITQILQSFGQTDLLSYMNTYWPDYQGNNEAFWEHEWGKHGTCVSTLRPSCYTNYQPTQEVVDFFSRTVSLFKGLNSYQFLKSAGIVPSNTATYSLSSVQSALANNFNGYTPVVRCSSGAINEIWYYYNVRGSVQSGTFVPVGSDGSTTNCPATVSYVPKAGGSSPTSSSNPVSSTPASSPVSSPASSPTSSPGTITGKGFLNVAQSGSTNGCLISTGKWYTTGTCATYTATASGSGFTLKGSKGFCGILSDGSIDCTQTTGAVFGASGTTLLYGNSANFYATSVPSGSAQATVYVNSQTQKLSIVWSAQ